jgi:adenylyl-sulfate kinase
MTTLWFTGLPGAGKTTLARALQDSVKPRHLIILDGDELRASISADLGFSPEDRSEQARRVAALARLLNNQGVNVAVCLVSPSATDREMARQVVGTGFVEVFVDAPLEVVEERDPKGLYAKARRGELKGLTGLDAPYEAPVAPEVHLRSAETSLQECVQELLKVLGSGSF